MDNLFPLEGQEPKQILEQLTKMKQQDIPWQDGKVFAYLYDPGEKAAKLTKEAYSMYLSENGLDPTVFQSLLQLEREIIRMALELVHGNSEASGSFTSGGTESIMLAVKSARDFAKAEKQILEPEIILPHTAHAAFYKSCHYLGIKPVVVEVDPQSYRAIPSKMEEAITPNTILMVASAPSYAHGVVDPVSEIAAIARKHELLLHVDACVGGMFLPFAKQLGYEIPAFDFSIEGVSSLSIDFHKYGYAAKGASAVLYNHPSLRQYQIYTCAEWPGYAVVNPTILSSKTGGPLAACWAIMQHWGKEGYLQRVDACMKASKRIQTFINKHVDLSLLGCPDMNLIAISSKSFNVFKIADKMKEKGWYVQVQLAAKGSPANLHLSVNHANLPQVDGLLADLQNCLEEMPRESPQSNPQLVAMLPMLAQMPAKQVLEMLSQGLGLKAGEVPQEMATINNLLNQLPPNLRTKLLTAYVDRLF